MKNSSVAGYLLRKMLEHKVLMIDFNEEFKLNNGQYSKFFYNFGQFKTSLGLHELGFIFGQTIDEYHLKFDVLFGAAYKGIRIADAAAYWLWTFQDHHKKRNIEICHDRKEMKLHGEKGNLVGADITGKRILIVDDVITSGKAIKRVLNTLKPYNIASVEILVGVNRGELEEIDGVKIHYIIHHEDVLRRLDRGLT